jgi:Tol biopolymer transport system component
MKNSPFSKTFLRGSASRTTRFISLLAISLCGVALSLSGCGGSGGVPSNSDIENGKRILLFRSGSSSDGGLYTIKNDGAEKTKVIDGAQQPGSGRLSRDRNFLTTALGSVRPRLAIAQISNGTPVNFADSSQYTSVYDPAFSPNTSSMVFVGDNDLFTIGTDSKNLKKLTNVTDGVPSTKIPPTTKSPAYLDDASGILYVKSEAVNKPAEGQPQPVIPTDIYRISTDGATEVKLTDSKNNDAPRARPDGARITFTTTRDGNPDGAHEIYAMNADGTSPTRLTTNNADDVTPVYSPDGKNIAFLSDRDKKGQYKIYIMDENGSNVRKVSDSLAAVGTLDWR